MFDTYVNMLKLVNMCYVNVPYKIYVMWLIDTWNSDLKIRDYA